MKQALFWFMILTLTACATPPRKRFLYGAGIGAGLGALGGAAFSPNPESKGMNALVFGLTGAVLGGVVSLFAHDDSEVPKAKDTLQERELGQEFVVRPDAGKLPSYVKDRLQPLVIEEYVEKDSINEDGGLSEPHKVWRIKRPAELVGKPASVPEAKP
jgi:gas vesicle protein